MHETMKRTSENISYDDCENSGQGVVYRCQWVAT